MAEDNKILERVYTVPLRRHWVNVPQYKRARKAVVALKEFIAKHMHVTNRDVRNVRINSYLNNELWFRGKTNPPAKIKVKAIKEGDVVRVEFFEYPAVVKHLKTRHAKMHKKADKNAVAPVAEKKAEKSDEQKKDEVEKEKAVEQQNIKQAEAAAHAAKHTTPVKEPKINRMALKK
jgi:large subunit ribosomal protein L31e